MEVSRLLFSKETKEKMKKGVNARERGKLRYQRLVELANDGRLAVAKNRNEVANMVGIISKPNTTGYNWVTNMIRGGHLTETLMALGDGGKPEYEYHLTSKEPCYDGYPRRVKATSEVKEKVEPPKPKKKSNLFEVGKQRYAALKETEANGTLALAKSRNEVADLVHGTRSWVCGLIERGYLREVLYKYENGIPVYKYNLTGKEPNYDHVAKNTASALVNNPPKQEEHVTNEKKPIKIEITRGDVVIKAEFDDYEQAAKTITTILKGE